jgi:hypothetical protein
MATPSNRPPHIRPAQRVVMRTPDTDITKDPWTGAPITSGRNCEDPSLVDENTRLAPAEGKSSAQLLEELEGPRDERALAQQEVEPPARPQFSLAELLVLTTIAAVGLAGARALPAGPFACLVGVLGFAAMWLTGHWQIRNRWVHLGVWGLVMIYVIAAAAAIWRS